MDYIAFVVIGSSAFLIQDQDVWAARRDTEMRGCHQAPEGSPHHYRLQAGRGMGLCSSWRNCGLLQAALLPMPIGSKVPSHLLMLLGESVGKDRSEGDDGDSDQTQEGEKWNVCLMPRSLSM